MVSGNSSFFGEREVSKYIHSYTSITLQKTSIVDVFVCKKFHIVGIITAISIPKKSLNFFKKNWRTTVCFVWSLVCTPVSDFW